MIRYWMSLGMKFCAKGVGESLLVPIISRPRLKRLLGILIILNELFLQDWRNSSRFEVGKCRLAEITDFGLSVVKTTSMTSVKSDECGTPQCMAPEFFSLVPIFSTKSDVYAFSIILWELRYYFII